MIFSGRYVLTSGPHYDLGMAFSSSVREPGLPMWRHILHDLQRSIATGELRSGDRVPTERQLSEQYACSRTSVRMAIREASGHGLVEIRHPRGTFVTNQ